VSIAIFPLKPTIITKHVIRIEESLGFPANLYNSREGKMKHFTLKKMDISFGKNCLRRQESSRAIRSAVEREGKRVCRAGRGR